MHWFIAHWQEILGVTTSLVAAASAVSALTPTPKDDTWVGKAYRVLDWLALNVGKAKDAG